MARPDLKKLTWILPEHDFGFQRQLRCSSPEEIVDQWMALFALAPQCPALRIRIVGANDLYYSEGGTYNGVLCACAYARWCFPRLSCCMHGSCLSLSSFSF